MCVGGGGHSVHRYPPHEKVIRETNLCLVASLRAGWGNISLRNVYLGVDQVIVCWWWEQVGSRSCLCYVPLYASIKLPFNSVPHLHNSVI